MAKNGLAEKALWLDDEILGHMKKISQQGRIEIL